MNGTKLKTKIQKREDLVLLAVKKYVIVVKKDVFEQTFSSNFGVVPFHILN